MAEESLQILSIIILVLPLVACVCTILLPERFRVRAYLPAAVLMCISFGMSLYILIANWNIGQIHFSFDWFRISETATMNAGMLLSFPALAMMLVVTLIAFLVVLFSAVYMKGEEGQRRYYSVISFFVFSMLGVVLADNLLLIFVFWELVGFSSYLLINHYYKTSLASKAAFKAFVVNRIGDAGFVVGLAVFWTFFGTLDITQLVFRMSESVINDGLWVWQDQSFPVIFLTMGGIGLFLGAAGKSAQFPFQVWLPDAMAGPTPVSALIHAATMVAAGVYLLARVFPLLGFEVLNVIAVCGALTAFMGAVAAMTQNDIKKVLAYSTISQLGYMVTGIGVGAYDAALFHLVTHAFFKAGLFLAAGSVIYAIHTYQHKKNDHFDAQDMRRMGGFRKLMPTTFVAYLLLSMALVGIPLFSGFLSKDAILTGAFAWSGDAISWKIIVPFLSLITVALTAFYMLRQLILIFFGKTRLGATGLKENPVLMRGIVIFLGLMSLGLVYSFNPFSSYDSWFFKMLKTPLLLAPDIPVGFQENIVSMLVQQHTMISIFSIAMILIGLALAWYKFRENGTYMQGYSTFDIDSRGMLARLSYNNWWLDTIYNRVIISPVMRIADGTLYIDRHIIDRFLNLTGMGYVIISNIMAWFDRNIIDGIANFVASLARFIGRISSGLIRGHAQYYLILVLIGSLIILWLVI